MGSVQVPVKGTKTISCHLFIKKTGTEFLQEDKYIISCAFKSSQASGFKFRLKQYLALEVKAQFSNLILREQQKTVLSRLRRTAAETITFEGRNVISTESP